MRTVTFRRPDDFHVHVRDGVLLPVTVPATARAFARGVIMPNLVPPVTTSAMAAAYRDRVMAAVPAGVGFTPLMTIYMTDSTDASDLVAGYRDGVVFGVKLYPAHATTNSAHGVTDFDRIAPVLEAMQLHGIPLLVHGEVTRAEVDVFDREARFVEEVFVPLLKRYPRLKVVMEHVTTAEGVALVRAHADRMAGTVTPQHLLYDRNALFNGGLRPHLYCLPILKKSPHKRALRDAVTSGEACFMLGSDTAPHLKHLKEAACGCAGVFSAPVALAAYLQVFAEENALDRFEAFAALNGARFHGLPVASETVTYAEAPYPVPEALEVAGEGEIVPLFGGEQARWAPVGIPV